MPGQSVHIRIRGGGRLLHEHSCHRNREGSSDRADALHFKLASYWASPQNLDA